MRWRGLRNVLVSVWAAWATTLSVAHAEVVSNHLALQLNACEQPFEAEVRRIASVELRSTTLVEPGDDRVGVIQVMATCNGSQIELSLSEVGTTRRLERTLALSDATPNAQPRLLALAIAELVAANQENFARRSAPVERVAVGVPVIPTSQPSEPAAPLPRAALDAIGVLRLLPRSGFSLLGVGARGVLSLARPLKLWLESTVEWGKPSRLTGHVNVESLGGAFGLGWSYEMTEASLMPWLGARVGVARLSGEPRPSSAALGRTQSGPWLGPELGLTATLFPRAPAHATLALSTGVALLGVEGNVSRDRDVSVLGPWAACAIGIGIGKP